MEDPLIFPPLFVSTFSSVIDKSLRYLRCMLCDLTYIYIFKRFPHLVN